MLDGPVGGGGDAPTATGGAGHQLVIPALTRDSVRRIRRTRRPRAGMAHVNDVIPALHMGCA
jgi:hypothetical protein